eukprot:scaffold144589_cov19-Tisochrysis_lutea.AAC.1
MEALLESGEYAGKRLRPEQLDKVKSSALDKATSQFSAHLFTLINNLEWLGTLFFGHLLEPASHLALNFKCPHRPALRGTCAHR